MKLRNILIFQGLMLLSIALLAKVLSKGLIHQNISYIIVFFIVLAILNYRISQMAMANNREKFVAMVAASMVIRLVLSMLFLIFFIFNKVENPQIFAINFIVLYLCNLVFEIWESISNLRRF